ncbi:MAG: riboflavin synthase subunit alpha [Pseudomonadota bacterium]|nr:riboflavin synthase subunit alpha [Pseudomonadota bacterium]
MFAGIVQGLIAVQARTEDGELVRLSFDLDEMKAGLQLGASVAINGTCLTVAGVEHGLVSFDVIPETLRTTNLGQLKSGDKVNMERSVRIGDEIGGHMISGHVTGIAEILKRQVAGHDHVLRLQMDPAWAKFVFHKGFIGLDGASITVSSLDRVAHWFEVSLIPETLERTTLGFLERGASVNIEVDAQTVTTVETVERVLAEREPA